MDLESVFAFFASYWLQLLVTALLACLYVFLDRLCIPKLEQGVDQSRFKEVLSGKAIWMTRIVTGLAGLVVISLVWGVKLGSVFVFAGTTLTLLGVALFASWSILSNITACFVLLLHPSFRRGNFVRIIDGDNYAEGYISELSMFSTKLITENRETIVYPNNLLLSRPALINPRDKFSVMGKLPQHSPKNDDVDKTQSKNDERPSSS